MSSTDNTEHDDLSRSDELIEQIKRNRIVAGQFRFRTLMAAIVVFSAALAIPRATGWAYEAYFGFLWFTAFTLAPLLAYIAAAIVPRLQFHYRVIVAAAIAALATVPLLIFAILSGEADIALPTLVGVAIVFWLPQIVSIWAVWRFLFRKALR